jgi:hypothetical protein
MTNSMLGLSIWRIAVQELKGRKGATTMARRTLPFNIVCGTILMSLLYLTLSFPLGVSPVRPSLSSRHVSKER